MLNIIEGGLYSRAHEEIVEEIARLTEKGERVFLIVPEQKTVLAEAEMTDALPKSAPLSFEATNFTRFANTAFRTLGGISGEYSTRTTRALIMWRALTELSPFLSMTEGRRNIDAGTVDKALSAVADMQSLAIGADELLLALDSNNGSVDGRLKSKLSDLAKIISVYKRLLSEKYCDTGDDMATLSEKLDSNPEIFSGAHFFLEGFTSFTEGQYMLLKRLMSRAAVTVHVSIPKYAEDSFEYTELLITKNRLLSIADLANTKKTVKYILERRDGAVTLLSECQDLLFRTFGKVDKESIELAPPEALRLFRARTAYEECDFISADIKRRVMAGESYRDFAIIARNADAYFGLIDTSLKKAGIPSFISKTKSPTSIEAVKLIFSAIKTVSRGFMREDLLTYAKCGFSGISRDACDEFELYIETWQINGARFLCDEPWAMNPRGLTDKKTDADRERLLRINETRDTLLEPLMRYSEAAKAARTVREHAEALFELLAAVNLEVELKRKVRELVIQNEMQAAEDNSRIWQVICDALDVLVSALGDSEIDLSAFEMQLEVILSSMQLGRIPLYYDEVVIGSADTLRLGSKAHVYIIGANLGEFPKSFKESSYFSDKDKEKLASLGLNVTPDREKGYARELFAFSRAFASGEKTVTITAPDRNSAFEDSSPSEIFARIEEITDKAISARYISTLPLEERAYFSDGMISEIGKSAHGVDGMIKSALTESGFSEAVRIYEADIKNSGLFLGREVKGLLYKGDIRSSQSKLDKYISCPFSYFLRYDLGISEGERAEFNARNIGNFIHSVLENTLLEIKTHGGKDDLLSSEKKKEICTRAAKKYINSIYESGDSRSGREEILIDRLTKSALPLIDSLAEEFSGSEYTPEFFELHIGGKEADSPEPCAFDMSGGGKVLISGFVDRIDTYKDSGKLYVRVVDYKTGAKNFSPSDLDEGKNLQMFLYLSSIVNTKNPAFIEKLTGGEDLELIPAGVIYNLTNVNDVKIDRDDEGDEALALKDSQGRQGMLLDDLASISAMNPDYIPIKYKKSGELTESSKKYVYSIEGWDELNKKISSKISEVGERMRSGEITLTEEKKNSPCAYCKFRPICRDPRD